MEELINKILKTGRSIEPDAEFQKHSLRLIIATPQERHGVLATVKRELAENFRFGLTLAAATLLIFAFFGGLRYFGAANKESAAFNANGLKREAETLDFQIQLGEAQYFKESADEIAAMLNDIKSANTDKNIY